MKNLLISACVICFAVAAPTVLLADDKGHHDDKSKTHISTGSTGGGTHHDSMMMLHHDKMSGGMGSSHDHKHNDMMGNHKDLHVTIDFGHWHKNWTAEHHFHWGEYHAPPGWVYRHWGYGDHLDAVYYGRDYWINSYLNFGLEAPPDDCVWVRYGPDAVLVDEDTGEIVQVVYGLFY